MSDTPEMPHITSRLAPEPPARPVQDVLTVWARVLRRTVRSPSGCWLWQGAHNGKGYGTIGRPGQTNILVHRVALLVHKPDQLAPGERCASTSNRNFEGRQGKGGRTHLVSPPMAAAAAIAGHLVDVRSFDVDTEPAGVA